jgi:hypothetical protein
MRPAFDAESDYAFHPDAGVCLSGGVILGIITLPAWEKIPAVCRMRRIGAGTFCKGDNIMIHIQKKLNQLSRLHAQLNLLQSEKKRLIEESLPPEYGARLQEIEVEFAHKETTARQNIESLTAEVRSDTLAFGRSVRGSEYQAVWSRGRVSWDDLALRVYARAHSEILPFRKEGRPSISIRRIPDPDAVGQ